MKFRRILSATLILAMLLSLTSCGKGFKAKNTDEVLNILDELDYEDASEIENHRELKKMNYYYMNVEDMKGKKQTILENLSEQKLKGDLEDEIFAVAKPNEDNAVYFFYSKFTNKDEARNFFEDEVYEEIKYKLENNKDMFFDGDIEYNLSSKSGYVFMKGTYEVKDWMKTTFDFDCDEINNRDKSEPFTYSYDDGNYSFDFFSDFSGDWDGMDLGLGNLFGMGSMGDLFGMDGLGDLFGMDSWGGFGSLFGLGSLASLFDFEMPDFKIEDPELMVGIYYAEDTISVIVAKDNKASISQYKELANELGFPIMETDKKKK